MNNSFLSVETAALKEDVPVDITEMLRRRETDLLEEIDAFEKINSSNYWKVLQKKVFTPVLDSLQKKIRIENDTTEVFRLQGQLREAEKYTDFSKQIFIRRNELQNIRQQLHGKESPN